MPTVPTTNSLEMAKIPPQSAGPWKQLIPAEFHGRQRIAWFTYTFLGTEVSGTTVVRLCKIPKNARVIQITAISSGSTGTSTFPIGLIGQDGSGNIENAGALDPTTELPNGGAVADSATFFGTIAASTNPQTSSLANTTAQNCGYITRKDCQLIMGVATANITLTPTMKGYVEYVVD